MFLLRQPMLDMTPNTKLNPEVHTDKCRYSRLGFLDGWRGGFFYSPSGRCWRLALSECPSLLIKSLVLRCRIVIGCFWPFERGGTNSSRWCGWRQCMHGPGQRGSDRQECWFGIERVTAPAPAISWALYSFPTTGFQIEPLHMGSKSPVASYPPGGCVSSFTPSKMQGEMFQLCASLLRLPARAVSCHYLCSCRTHDQNIRPKMV